MPPDVRTTDVAEGVDPGSLLEDTYVDLVRLGYGCAVSCLSCGAFEGDRPEDRRVVPISIEQLEANITQTIENNRTGAKARLIDLFRSHVTSGVDMEPLGTGIFPEAAELIHKLSEGRSRLVAITHGLDCNVKRNGDQVKYEMPEAQKEKLEKIAQLMIDDVIPLLVLSMDSARRQGLPSKAAYRYNEKVKGMEKTYSPFMQIVQDRALQNQKDENAEDEGDRAFQTRFAKVKADLMDSVQRKMRTSEKLTVSERIVAEYITVKNKREDEVVEINARGYAETLYTLMPAISAGKRVTISLQGDENKDSLTHLGLARRIQQRTSNLLREKYRVSAPEINELFAAVNTIPPRVYFAAGRARKLGGASGVRKAAVIPDTKFIEGEMFQDDHRINRAKIEPDGTLAVQGYSAWQTYPDTVAPSEDNPWRVVNLTKDRVVAASELSIGKRQTGPVPVEGR